MKLHMKNKYLNKFEKRIIFVTGGSRGIGKEIVNKFLKSGAKVYFTYKNTKKSELNRYKNKNLIPIKCDMSNINYIDKLKNIFKNEKKIDVLVNNVGGVNKRTSFIKSDDKLWQNVMNLNLMSAVKTTRILCKFIMKSNNGVVINISSVASKTGGGRDSLHYAVAKAGINIFTKGLAKELKKVRVIGIAPGPIDTDFQKEYSSKKRLKRLISETPMGRIGTPQEIAELAYFISSSKVSFLSGETIFVGGGR